VSPIRASSDHPAASPHRSGAWIFVAGLVLGIVATVILLPSLPPQSTVYRSPIVSQPSSPSFSPAPTVYRSPVLSPPPLDNPRRENSPRL
jgi:hypothetical protein